MDAEIFKDNCITKVHPRMGDSSQKLENREHAAQHEGRAVSWRDSFPSNSVGLNVFQEALLLSESSLLLGLSESSSQL